MNNSIKENKVFSQQKQEIFDNFKWEKVILAMTALEWVYKDSTKTPTLNEIQEVANRVMNRAIETKQVVSTGGFEAEIKEGDLSLKFILVSWGDI